MLLFFCVSHQSINFINIWLPTAGSRGKLKNQGEPFIWPCPSPPTAQVASPVAPQLSAMYHQLTRHILSSSTVIDSVPRVSLEPSKTITLALATKPVSLLSNIFTAVKLFPFSPDLQPGNRQVRTIAQFLFSRVPGFVYKFEAVLSLLKLASLLRACCVFGQ